MAEVDVTVVDLGMSNVKSVVNMLNKVGLSAKASTKPEHIQSKLTILPGVGSFDEGMKGLTRSGWGSAIQDLSQSGDATILGLCLGMQLLTEGSEEGELEGLGVIPGSFRMFNSEATDDLEIKIPHMGWNTVDFTSRIEQFLPGISSNNRYYFVHSYYYHSDNDEFVAGFSQHGSKFPSAISSGKTLGLQFHPEKSHRFGIELFQRLSGVLDA